MAKQLSANKKDGADRLQIATYVITGVLLVIFLLDFLAIAVGNANINQMLNTQFPVLATWMGTVLAFYFSRENFESANKNVREMVELTTREKLQKHQVADVMIPYDLIMNPIVLDKDNTPDTVTIQDMYTCVPNEITRMFIVTKDHVLTHLLHRSILNRFIAAYAMDDKQGDPKQETLATLEKDYPPIKARAQAFVAETATLAEAKDAMDRIQGCQDVIITKTGLPTEPVLGWLSNIEIGKKSRA